MSHVDIIHLACRGQLSTEGKQKNVKNILTFIFKHLNDNTNILSVKIPFILVVYS